MTTRALTGIAAAFVLVVLLCSGLATILMVGGGDPGNANCYTTTSSVSAHASPVSAPPPRAVGAIGRWNAEQVGNAATIIGVGQALRIPPRGWVIAVAAAIQESSLINTSHGDRDSIGLFQQRS